MGLAAFNRRRRETVTAQEQAEKVMPETPETLDSRGGSGKPEKPKRARGGGDHGGD